MCTHTLTHRKGDLLIVNRSVLPGSGSLVNNVCYESTKFKQYRRPILQLHTSFDIEAEPTYRNPAYSIVGTVGSVRVNHLETHEYETIGRAKTTHTGYYNSGWAEHPL